MLLLLAIDYVRASLPPSAVAYAYTMKDAKVHLEKGLVCGQSLSNTLPSPFNTPSSPPPIYSFLLLHLFCVGGFPPPLT